MGHRTVAKQSRLNYGVHQVDASADRGTILACCRAGGLEISDEQYRWKFEENPLGRALCWVALEPVHDRVIGHLALFPRRLLVAGIPHRAAVVGDFVVEANHRTFWPAFLLQTAAKSACASGQFSFLYTFPNHLSRPVLLRAGYRSLGNFRTGVRLLQTRAVFRNRRHPLALNWPAVALDVALKWLSKESWFRRDDLRTQELSVFDERFDIFWAKVLPQFSGIVGRETKYANWRFASAAHNRYSTFAVQKQASGEVGGYIVWSENEGKVVIAELLAFDESLDFLIGEFIGMQRQRNAHSIVLSYFGGAALARKLQRFGFIFWRAPAEAVVCADSNLLPADPRHQTDGWYLVEGDADI
jgi:hypothetical protein